MTISADEQDIYDLQQKVYSLETEIERLKAEREWQPIETAPKGEEIEVWWSGKRYYSYFSEAFNAWYSMGERIYPTHWKPLTQPPEEE